MSSGLTCAPENAPIARTIPTRPNITNSGCPEVVTTIAASKNVPINSAIAAPTIGERLKLKLCATTFLGASTAFTVVTLVVVFGLEVVDVLAVDFLAVEVYFLVAM
ncbi:hypothetical protein D9M68_803130 [compost metagenome]